jgi:hypothetical protein
MSDQIILKADNKTSAIKEIIAIVPDQEDAAALSKATIKEIRGTYTADSQPCKYALIDNTDENFTIELDYTPGVTYDEDTDPDARLLVHYYPNYRILGDNSEYSEFEDYDEAHPEKGKWKLPSDWHKLIVDGALAMIYPELKDKWELDCAKKKAGQYTNTDFRLKSFMGISGKYSGRRFETIKRY